MKRTIIIELIWLIGIGLASWVLFGIVSAGTALDISLHDTYIRNITDGTIQLMSVNSFIFAYFVSLGLSVYLVRALYFNFAAVVTDFGLLVMTLLFLFFFGNILYVIYPPDFESIAPRPSAPPGLFYGFTEVHSSLWIRVWIQTLVRLLLMFILIFTGFKIGRNWKMKPN